MVSFPSYKRSAFGRCFGLFLGKSKILNGAPARPHAEHSHARAAHTRRGEQGRVHAVCYQKLRRAGPVDRLEAQQLTSRVVRQLTN